MVTADALNSMIASLWPTAGVRCVAVSETDAVASMTPTAQDLRPGGFISGPMQFAMADTAFWFLVSGALGRVEPMALTSELSIRYLRPAVGETLYGRATLDRLGRTSVVATVRVWTTDEARPTAVAQGTYTLPATPTDLSPVG